MSEAKEIFPGSTAVKGAKGVVYQIAEMDTEFYNNMKEFAATYGFELWWVKGGFWSNTWKQVFDYSYGLEMEMPAALRKVDYALEGKGITTAGTQIIAEQGFDKPNLAVSASIINFLKVWDGEIKKTVEDIEGMVEGAPEQLMVAISNIHDSIVTRYNEILTMLEAATARTAKIGVPPVSEIKGGMATELDSMPIYTLVSRDLMTAYAQLLLFSRQAETDIRASLQNPDDPQGVVVDAMQGGPEEKSKAWMWLLGGGILLTVIVIFGYTIYGAEPKRLETRAEQ